ncbi:MAG: VOC family protein [Chloroflexi bacterium]|nr:VOC family protein [Chloroflexota bacterium]
MTDAARFGFAIEYVSDTDAARRFYADVLGLQPRRVHPRFVQFDHFAVASDESLSGTGETELYWLVDDADAALAEMATKTAITMPLQTRAYGKVFAITGPAGRPQYVLELAANRPSEVVSAQP